MPAQVITHASMHAARQNSSSRFISLVKLPTFGALPATTGVAAASITTATGAGGATSSPSTDLGSGVMWRWSDEDW